MPQEDPHKGSSSANDTNQSIQQANLGASESSRDELLICLLQMTRLKATPCSETTLVAGLPLVDQLLTPELLVRAAARAGLDAKVIKRDLFEIPAIVLPIVLLLDNNKAVVLKAFNKAQNQAVIVKTTNTNSDDDAELNVSLSKLMGCYSGYCIFVKAETHFEQVEELFSKKKSDHWF